MKTLSLALLIVTVSCDPAFAQHAHDHLDIVVAIKAELIAQRVPLVGVGPCGPFQITKRVAWTLRHEGAGVLAKGGNNCDGYSVDAVIFPDGTHYDVVGASEEANTPVWNLVVIEGTSTPFKRPEDYRPAIDPGDVVTPPPPPPPPPPVGDVLAEMRAVKTIAEQAREFAAEAVLEIKAHRAGVQNVWLKVSAIAGPIVTWIVTYFQTRGGSE